MRALKAHAALFALAAAAALATWTRDAPDRDGADLHLVWERDTADVVAVRYRGPGGEVELLRRSDEAGAYLWGVEVRGAARDDTLEYPVGAPGRTLAGRLARLRAIRDLGVLSPELLARFGLEPAPERIEVDFADERRTLLVGDSAYGGRDRYAVEPATGIGYVVSHDVASPLAIGEGALRERWLHNFAPDDVASVRVAAPGGTPRQMARGEDGEWTEMGGGAPDAAFANFMERVGQLAIGGYGAAVEAGAVRTLLRIDYLDGAGEPLGFVELMRDDLADRDPYYIRSETTRVAAFAVASLAERVEQALEEAL